MVSEEKDITVPARKILYCIYRIYQKLGYYIGAALVIRTLYGSSEKRILMLKLNELPTYGLMSDTLRGETKTMLESLESQGYLQTAPEHGGIFPMEKAKDILFRQESVYMLVPGSVGPKKKDTEVPRPHDDLLAVLKDLRLRLAKEARVPDCIIFPMRLYRIWQPRCREHRRPFYYMARGTTPLSLMRFVMPSKILLLLRRKLEDDYKIRYLGFSPKGAIHRLVLGYEDAKNMIGPIERLRKLLV